MRAKIAGDEDRSEKLSESGREAQDVQRLGLSSWEKPRLDPVNESRAEPINIFLGQLQLSAVSGVEASKKFGCRNAWRLIVLATHEEKDILREEAVLEVEVNKGRSLEAVKHIPIGRVGSNRHL